MDEARLKNLLAEGVAALSKRDLNTARRAFEAVLAEHPEHPEATRYLRFATIGSGTKTSDSRRTLPPEQSMVFRKRKPVALADRDMMTPEPIQASAVLRKRRAASANSSSPDESKPPPPKSDRRDQ